MHSSLDKPNFIHISPLECLLTPEFALDRTVESETPGAASTSSESREQQSRSAKKRSRERDFTSFDRAIHSVIEKERRKMFREQLLVSPKPICQYPLPNKTSGPSFSYTPTSGC